MAAYAYTATIDQLHSEQIETGTRLGILTGQVDVTNYNTTNAEVTEITGQFKTIHRVLLGISDNGFFGEWTGTSIKVHEATGNAGAAEEADDDDDAGVFDFIAIGIRG